ncbi:MAG: phosphopantothenoylcysteine decarboxylase [Verrucomicrobiota bacterium]
MFENPLIQRRNRANSRDMRFLITAGPTREAIDPVRYLSNHSSGKMGVALAAAAVGSGHEAVLIAGPVCLPAPEGVERVDIVSAEEMYAAVETRIDGVDAAIFCAAVADYRPVDPVDQKIKKSDERMTIELERTRDILGSARDTFHFDGLLVGFAAETENVRENALSKLERKGCDFLVANDVSDPSIGFGSDDNAVTVYSADGREFPLGRRSKADLASQLIDLFVSGPAK